MPVIWPCAQTVQPGGVDAFKYVAVLVIKRGAALGCNKTLHFLETGDEALFLRCAVGCLLGVAPFVKCGKKVIVLLGELFRHSLPALSFF